MRLKKHIIVCITIFLIGIGCTSIFVLYHSKTNNNDNLNISQSINLNNYKNDSRERYIVSLTIENNITYEEADVLETDQIANNPLYSKDFTLEYKTINKLAGTIENSDYKQEVSINIEARYLKNNTNHLFSRIDEFGGITLYLNSIDNTATYINGGGYNIEKYATMGRISQTAIIEYISKDNPYKKSYDIEGIKKVETGYQIRTKAKTYAINITDADF